MIELIPAEVIVRRDLREKLRVSTARTSARACPIGDMVVANGKRGLALPRFERDLGVPPG